MKQGLFVIREQKRIAKDVYQMRLEGDASAVTAPGQFINIRLEGRYLRRPISVCDYSPEQIVIIYKVVGGGTAQMAAMAPGQTLDCLTGLGNGFSTEKSGQHPVLVGGGAGVPPLYRLAKDLLAQNKQVSAVLGFASEEDVFYQQELEELGAAVSVATADGSYGVKGFVTDLPLTGYSYCYACGPIPMLQAVAQACDCSGQFSFEERMGCGFGACMGCSCKTLYGNKRICKEGPVLEKEEIIWEQK